MQTMDAMNAMQTDESKGEQLETVEASVNNWMPNVYKEGDDFSWSTLEDDEKEYFLFVLENVFFIRLHLWQQLMLWKMLSGDFSELSYIVPRRNGKSWVLVAYMCLQLLAGRSVIYTSYTLPSMQELYQTLANTCTHSLFPHMFTLKSKDVVRIKCSDTQGEIRFATRNSTSMRGFGCDVLLMDEANNIRESEMATFSPLVANSKLPLIVYSGTPSVQSKAQITQGEIPFFDTIIENNLNKDFKFGAHYGWQIANIESKEEMLKEETLKRYNPSYGASFSFLPIKHKVYNKPPIEVNALNARSFSYSNAKTFATERLGYQEPHDGNKISDLFDLQAFKFKDKKAVKVLADSMPLYCLSINAGKLYTVITLIAQDGTHTYCEIISVTENRELDKAKKEIEKAISLYKTQRRCKQIILQGVMLQPILAHLKKLKYLPRERDVKKFGKFSVAQNSYIEQSCGQLVTSANSGDIILFDTPYYSKHIQEVFPFTRNVFGNEQVIGFQSDRPSALVDVFTAFATGYSYMQSF